MRKICFFVVLFSVFCVGTANAQYASQKDASYVIIAKIMADHKMNDEEYVNDIAALRENQRFNNKLQKMLEATSNSKNKDAKSKKVDTILRKAGEDIEKALGVR